MSAVYLCNQRMFSPPRATNRLRDGVISEPTATPLRLVFFDELPEGNPVYDRWMGVLRQSYEFGPVRDFVIAPGKPKEMWLRDRYLSLELRPRAGAPPVAQSEVAPGIRR
jgi:hypothetical protein